MLIKVYGKQGNEPCVELEVSDTVSAQVDGIGNLTFFVQRPICFMKRTQELRSSLNGFGPPRDSSNGRYTKEDLPLSGQASDIWFFPQVKERMKIDFIKTLPLGQSERANQLLSNPACTDPIDEIKVQVTIPPVAGTCPSYPSDPERSTSFIDVTVKYHYHQRDRDGDLEEDYDEE